MQRETYDLMFDQVRATYRALTGADLPSSGEARAQPAPSVDVTPLVMRAFNELEQWVRMLPPLAERVPPFSFVPAVDVYEWEKELVIELGAPGVEQDDVRVERLGNMLVISGLRRAPRVDGRTYRRAELPRGPFRRVVELPPDTSTAPPRVEMAAGLLRIRIGKPAMGNVAQA